MMLVVNGEETQIILKLHCKALGEKKLLSGQLVYFGCCFGDDFGARLECDFFSVFCWESESVAEI